MQDKIRINIKRNFTLIELLVVIAIIGILASILMPSLQRARQASYRAVCASNQKQIGILLALYTDSNDTQYPIYGTTHEDEISWDDLLSDYDGRDLTMAEKLQSNFSKDEHTDDHVYICPANVQERNRRLRSYTLNESHNGAITNNSAIRAVAGWKNGAGWSMKTGEIKNATNFIAITEAHLFNNIMGFTGAGGRSHARVFIQNYSPNQLPQHASDKGGISGFYVHGAKTFRLNILFGDGHVDIKSIRDTLGTTGGTNFLTGASTSWSHLVNTPWNALAD